MQALCACISSGAQRLRLAQTQQRESVRVLLPRHQFTRSLALATDSAAHEAPVIQKELQQGKVRAPEVAAQREVRAQPRVQVLHQRAAARRVRHRARHGVEDEMKLVRLCGAQLGLGSKRGFFG